jgi:hypothetical protein
MAVNMICFGGSTQLFCLEYGTRRYSEILFKYNLYSICLNKALQHW